MAINIPSKFGSGLPEKNKKSVGINFQKISEKHRFEQENIKPYFDNENKNLWNLYRDECILFSGNYYLGKSSFGFEKNRDDDYTKIGHILAKL